MTDALPFPERLTPTPFWFLRHGETDWNANGLSQGNIDIPLNAVGLEQAKRAAEAMRDKTIATIVSSPLSRARVTAETVAAALGLPVQLDEQLHEVEFGEQEGQPMGDWYDDWIAGRYTPEGGESFAALRARAIAAINRALERPAPVLIVAHGALWRAVRQVAGMEPNVRTPNALPIRMTPPAPGETVWGMTPGL